LDESAADVTVKVGDGRRLLTLERDASCDVLVVDAFTSDTIPTHLLTEEAVELYLDKTKPDGVVVLHISNRFMDLRRVFRGLARETSAEPLVQDFRPTDGDRAQGAARTAAVALTGSTATREALLSDGTWRSLEPDGPSTYWTDDRTNLMGVLLDR
jgi:spermidine synthase